MKHNQIKKITTVSVLIALACILSILDRFISGSLISAIPYLGAIAPGFKLGIANLVIIIIIYSFEWPYSLIAVLLKSVIAGLIYAGFTNFLIGFSGTILSYLAMILFKNIIKKDFFMIYVSALGGLIHSLGQLLVVYLIYQTKEILTYFPIILIFGLVTGIIIGVVGFGIYKIIKNFNGGIKK